VPSAIYIAIFLGLFATILLQRWQQMNIAGRLIVAVCRMFQGFISYGIIRLVNLFSDQSPFVTSLWSFVYLFV
jgi:hypothetical protein